MAWYVFHPQYMCHCYSENSMMSNKLLLSFFCVSACFIIGTVGRLSGEGIVGGQVARSNQFPYQVSLRYYTSSFCGGGIIGDQFILTAGHCVVNKDGEFITMSLKVTAGTNDLRYTVRAVTVKVAKIYVPSIYLPETDSSYGDIAVLKLEKPLGLSTHANLKKLQLPKNPRKTYAGETVMIAGYGWDWVEVNFDQESGGKTDTSLRFAEADVLSNTECQSGQATHVYDAQICARTKQHYLKEASGVCSGDSGGPLVYKNRVVVGVVSTSPIGCTEKVSAAIYTRVSSFLDFIDDAMNDRENDKIRSIELIPSSRPSERIISSISHDEPTESTPNNWWVWT